MPGRRGDMGNPPAALVDKMFCSHMAATGVVDDYGGGPGDVSVVIQEDHGNIFFYEWIEVVQFAGIRREECNDPIHPPVKEALCIGNLLLRAAGGVHDDDAVSRLVCNFF